MSTKELFFSLGENNNNCDHLRKKFCVRDSIFCVILFNNFRYQYTSFYRDTVAAIGYTVPCDCFW